MTIIEQIKAEIEKLIERYGSVKAKGVLQEGYKGGRLIGYEDALDILKRIQEESEKPMNQEGLEEEAVNYCFDNGLNLSPRVATDFARHFAEWGAEHLADARKTSPKDLEEAAWEYAKAYTDNDNGNGGDDWEDDIKITFIAGAKWMEEQLKK